MNDNAKQWAAALRSSRFRQGRNRLHTVGITDADDELCCLGVACVLAVEAGVPLTVTHTRGRHEVAMAYDGEAIVLPPVVQNWLGLASDSGQFHVALSSLDDVDTTFSDALSERNDSGSSFEEIAEIIESEPEGLFA